MQCPFACAAGGLHFREPFSRRGPVHGRSPSAGRRRSEVELRSRGGGATRWAPRVRSVADPLGLCAADIRSDTAEVLVLPRVHRVDERDLALIGGTGRSSRETPQEIDSLRAHRPGGPASRIHWPTVARSGVLMEHSLRPEDDPRVLVEVDAMRPESGRALDQALSAAASLCVHLARHGGCLLLLPDDARAAVIRADLRGWPGLHARLALVQAGTSAPRIRRNVRALTVIHVTAASGPEPAIGGPHYRVAPSPLPEWGWRSNWQAVAASRFTAVIWHGPHERRRRHGRTSPAGPRRERRSSEPQALCPRGLCVLAHEPPRGSSLAGLLEQPPVLAVAGASSPAAPLWGQDCSRALRHAPRAASRSRRGPRP